MKRIFFVLIVVFGFLSCKKDEIETKQESPLIGQWDSYYFIWDNQSTGIDAPAYNVLFNYEQGFEIFKNNTYLSRYTIGNGNVNTGTWQTTTDSITFNHITSDNNTETLVFALVKLEANELIIKRRDGLSIYLRKNL